MNESSPDKPWAGLARTDPCVVALGLFDGVHVGHQVILDRVIHEAKRLDVDSVVFSFSNHPKSVISEDGSRVPRYLIPPRRRYELMEEAGIGRVLSPEFTWAWAKTPPEEFAKDFLADTLQARHVVVGFNYCFGRKAEGRVHHLEEFGEKYGFEVDVVPPYRVEGKQVSSTRIRKAILAGDLAEAETLLGRPHELCGIVIRGDGRGKKLGFPTANLDPDLPPLLPRGVYAVRVFQWTNGSRSELGEGMFFLGPRKTFGEGEEDSSVEVHLFDFEEELYGAHLRLELVGKIRDGMKFESAEALVRQLERDRLAAVAILSDAARSAIQEN